MIKSFTHKGLAAYYRTGSVKGIVPQHAKRLRLILSTLDDAIVNGNWRVIFAFEGEDVILIDYLDYH